MTAFYALMIPEREPVRILAADTFYKRFMGLMGKKESDYGLILTPCNAIHTCFMRYDLDIVYLDADRRILEIKNGIKPWRATRAVRNAHSVLELPSSLQLTRFLKPGTTINMR